MTGGMGSYTMEFSHYDVMPSKVQREIIAKAERKDEEEEAYRLLHVETGHLRRDPAKPRKARSAFSTPTG
jgi:hypothetical protein